MVPDGVELGSRRTSPPTGPENFSVSMFRKAASRAVSWRMQTGAPLDAPLACAGEPTVSAGVGGPGQHEAPGHSETAAMPSYQTPVFTRRRRVSARRVAR